MRAGPDLSVGRLSGLSEQNPEVREDLPPDGTWRSHSNGSNTIGQGGVSCPRDTRTFGVRPE